MIGNCPVCSNRMKEAFVARVLRKYQAVFDHCYGCGFLRARDPNWLEEAYSSPIGAIDTGLLARNIMLSNRLIAICPLFGNGKGSFLDYAGGYGVLVRLMRDRGFNFWWLDKYASNLMARGFEYSDDRGPCAAVTAFEALEHVEQPVEFIREALNVGQSEILIFTTELFVGPPPDLSWMYYAFEAGQHISFYRRDTLEWLAKSLNMYFQTYRGLHFLSKKPLDASRLASASSRPGVVLARLKNRRRPSLTETDSINLRCRAIDVSAEVSRPVIDGAGG